MKKTLGIIMLIALSLGVSDLAYAQARLKGRADQRENVRGRREDVRGRKDVHFKKAKKQKIDTNDDGKVSKEERRAFFESREKLRSELKIDQQNLKAQFKADRQALRRQYDLDGNGKLSKDERQQLKDALEELKKEHKFQIRSMKQEHREEFKDYWKNYDEESLDKEEPAEE